MRRKLLPYPALVALALSLFLAPTLAVAAGNVERPSCDPRFITVDLFWSNASTVPGINDWRQIARDSTHDSTGFDGFYIDRVGGAFVKFDPPAFGTANVLTRRFSINDEGNISCRYLDTFGVNHAHFSSETGAKFLNPIDRRSASFTRGFGLNAKKNMLGAYVNSTDTVGHTYFLRSPGWELPAFHLQGTIDMSALGIYDLGGIAGACFKAGSALIGYNLGRHGGNYVDTIPRGAVATGAESINNLDDRGSRHTVLFRRFEW